MKTVWIILISFVVTAAIVGGGTYYFVNAKATKDKDNLQAQITDLNKKYDDSQQALTAAQSTIASTTASVTADWKTYDNKNIGFSFKYPTSWKVTDDNKGNISVVNTAKVYEMEGGSLDPIVVSYVKDTSGASIDNYLTGVRAAFKPLLKESITIDGKTAHVIQGTLPPTSHDSRIIFFNGYVISFSSNGGEIAGQDTEGIIPATFSKILGTVKFSTN